MEGNSRDHIREQILESEYEITCPNGHKFQAMVKDLLTGSVQCPIGAETFSVDASQFQDEIRRAIEGAQELADTDDQFGSTQIGF